MNKLKIVFLMSILIASLSSLSLAAGYTDSLFNSCFSTPFNFFLCPFNAVAFLPELFCVLGFIVSFRKTNSIAVSFLSAAIVSYILLLLYASANVNLTQSLTVSIMLSIAWIMGFAYEVNQ